jgi:hypothetical protein
VSGQDVRSAANIERKLAREQARKRHYKAECEVLRRQVAELQAMVDDLFERNGWVKIGWERPPEHVFEAFRRIHGIK